MDENPVGLRRVVNGRYPDNVPVSTMPPPVLQTLPKLSEGLEYRFVGDDLIILDVVMPDANGFDILNRIRQHSVLKDLPVMMLTSLGSLDDILKGLKLGANGYLTKPAKSKSLLDAIRKVLGD